MDSLRSFECTTVRIGLIKTLLIGLAFFVIPPLPAYSQYSGLIKKIHPNIPDKRAENLSRLIIQESRENNFPSDVVVAVIWKETHFINIKSNVVVDTETISDSAVIDSIKTEDSCGYGQIHVETARHLLGEDVTCKFLIRRWRLNVALAVDYLDEMRQLTGHIAGAIGRYNGKHNLDYVYDVLKKRERIKDFTDEN